MSQNQTLFKKTIYLATDHAGFEHKQQVLAWLSAEGCDVKDMGAFIYDDLDDFPDFIKLAAKAVSENPDTSCAVIFGGSGQGEAMVANRFKSVRATVYYGGEDEIINLSRIHNQANILSIGARFVPVDEAKKVIWNWLNQAAGSDEKYLRRNLKIDADI